MSRQQAETSPELEQAARQQKIVELKDKLVQLDPQRHQELQLDLQPHQEFQQKFEELKALLATPSSEASSSNEPDKNKAILNEICSVRFVRCCFFLNMNIDFDPAQRDAWINAVKTANVCLENHTEYNQENSPQRQLLNGIIENRIIKRLQYELENWNCEQQKVDELKEKFLAAESAAANNEEHKAALHAILSAQYTRCCELLASDNIALTTSWETLYNIELIALFCVHHVQTHYGLRAQLDEQTIHINVKKILIQKLTHELENWDCEQQPSALFKKKFLLLQQVLPLPKSAKLSEALSQTGAESSDTLPSAKLTEEHQNILNTLLAAQYEKCCAYLESHSPLEFTPNNICNNVGMLILFCVDNHTVYHSEDSIQHQNAAKLLRCFKTEMTHEELQTTLTTNRDALLQELKMLIAFAKRYKHLNHEKKFNILFSRLSGGKFVGSEAETTPSLYPQKDFITDWQQHGLTSDFFAIKYHNAEIAVELHLEAQKAEKTAPENKIAAYANGITIATAMLQTKTPFRLPHVVSAELERIDTLIPNRRGSKLKGIALISLGVFLIGATIAAAAATWSTGAALGLKALPIAAGAITVGFTALGVAVGVSSGIYSSYKGAQLFKPKFGKDTEKCGEEYHSTCRSA